MNTPYVRLLNVAAERLQNHRFRAGQGYYLALCIVDPEMCICILDTSFDPFHDDANLQRFMIYCQYQWGMLDSDILQVGIERECDDGA